MKLSKGKSFFLLTFSTLLIAAGIYFFKFPNNFSFGGITGLAVILAKITPFTAGDLTFSINMLLLVIGFLFIGKKFTFKTAYSAILLSASLSLFERVCPLSGPLTTEPVLELAFAIALPSFGSAILFNMEASSGGTDIIAMLLKKYSNVNIGNSLLITDCLITGFSFFVFGLTTGLYSMLGLAIRSFLVDNVIESINLCKYFNVFCSDPGPICDYITETLHRGATTAKAKGAFSGNNKYIIFTVLNRNQAVKLRQFIKETDPNAFILISNTSEIIGKGFHSI